MLVDKKLLELRELAFIAGKQLYNKANPPSLLLCFSGKGMCVIGRATMDAIQDSEN